LRRCARCLYHYCLYHYCLYHYSIGVYLRACVTPLSQRAFWCRPVM
jgi:hypothetical protein